MYNFKSIIKYNFLVTTVFCYILNLSFLFIFLLTITNFYFHSDAHATPQSASVVMDTKTGEIIRSRNANYKLHPAGLTKLMTLYVTYDAIKNNEISLNKLIVISKNTTSEQEPKAGLKAGRSVFLRDLITAVALMDANDAATAIAEAVSGAEIEFVKRMNATARSLRMNDTFFKNAHGLSEVGHLSSAHDMTVLARKLILDFPDFYKLLIKITSPTDFGVVRNENVRFLRSNTGVDFIKGGYNRRAGYNLTSSVVRSKKKLIVTVFGGKTTGSRNTEVTKLFDLGFSRLKTVQSPSAMEKRTSLDSECNKKLSNPKDKPREFGELRETFKEWDYYIGNDGCWIVTSSISKRIDTLNPVPSCLNGSSLAITNHIGEKSLEVSIGADFLLEEDVLVSLFLGQRKYPFFTEDDYAWPKSREDEPRIINDLKNIQIGVVEFYRSNEKSRTEIFSSAGFGEAYKAINSQCPFKQYVYK